MRHDDLRTPTVSDIVLFGTPAMWLGLPVGMAVLAGVAAIVHLWILPADQWRHAELLIGLTTTLAYLVIYVSMGTTLARRTVRRRRAAAEVRRTLDDQDRLRRAAQAEGWTVTEAAAPEAERERALVEATGELGTLDFGLSLAKGDVTLVEFWRQDGEEGPVVRAFQLGESTRRPGRLTIEVARALA